MTYAEGDPGHIDVHESIRLLFMAAGLDPDLIPAEATLGATTHIEDHNKIAEALAWIDAEGVLGPGDAVIGSTTGSPTTGTFTYEGDTYNWTRFTGAGSVTPSTTGLAKLLVCAGGGGAGGDGGGGAGGYIALDVILESGYEYPVTIGAGGAGSAGTGTGGGDSWFGPIRAYGGGNGAASTGNGGTGGSGGGGSRTSTSTGGTAYLTTGRQGYNGGGSQGSGGGAGSVGLIRNDTPTVNGQSGGAGKQWINGTWYCGGGGGSGSTDSTQGRTAGLTNGAANTGAGGGNHGGNGAAGVVIVAVKA